MSRRDNDNGPEMQDTDVLKGTTLRVYRFIFKEGTKPVRAYDIQRALNLSSHSVAHYHIDKLVNSGLIHEMDGGYVADRIMFGNLVKVRRMVLPFQITYSVLFASALVILLTFLRPASLTSTYVFSLVVIWLALSFSLYEGLKAYKGL